jgi:uncharacterized protein YbjT (DUF2867 family)
MAMHKMKILITAANGNTGYPAAKELLKMGHAVRVFVRNSHSEKARDLKSLGAEIFVGDIEDIRDVRLALKDVDNAYFVPTYPNVLYQGASFATVLEEMKTAHVVVVSQWLASNTNPSIYTKEHWLVDQGFKRLTQTKVTFLNPGLFGFIYFMTPEPLAQLGMLPDFGENAPPSSEDIGLVAAHILKAPAAHVDKTYRITGPKLLDAGQMAAIIAKVLGRKVKAAPLPEKMLFKVLKASGVTQMDASQVKHYVEEGHKGTWAVNGPTNVVKDIVGKEPDDFETIARRYLLSQPMAKQTLANKFRAILFMMKAMMSPSWNMDSFEEQQGMPKFPNMKHSSESKEWLHERSTHLSNFAISKI